MTGSESRTRLLLVLAAIAASVLLFACRTSGQQTAGRAAASQAPERPRPPEASAEGVEPRALPVASRGEASPRLPAGSSTPPAVERPAATVSVQAPGQPGAPYDAGPAPREGRAGPAGERVYTNRDLERYRRVKEEFGLRDDVVAVDVTKPPTRDVVEKPSGLTSAERDAEIETTRERINGLMQELDYQKKRVLPIENPFVPQPRITEEDRLAEAGMDNKERLQRVKQRIAEIETEMGSLQRRLADLYNMKPSDATGEAGEEPARERE